MAYELVELSTANVVGFYETEREALVDVIDAIDRDGRAAIATLALGFNDPSGLGYAIADGEELAVRALIVIRGDNGHRVAAAPRGRQSMSARGTSRPG